MALRNLFRRTAEPAPPRARANPEQLKRFEAALVQRVIEHFVELGEVPSERPSILAVIQTCMNRLPIEFVDMPDDEVGVVRTRIADLMVTWGPLAPLMMDPEVSQITVNAHDKIFVEHEGTKREWSLHFNSDRQLRQTVEQLILLNPGKRLDATSPLVDLALPDSTRVNIVVPPAVFDGPHLTVRRYLPNYTRLSSFADSGSLDQRMVRFLEGCVKTGQSLLLCGASGAGKTSLMDALINEIDPNERIIAIEDTPELHITKPDVVRLLARANNVEGRGEITIADLFRNALRMRPDRILLGEIRGSEALDYLQALNAGNRGSLAIIHADSPREALLRMAHLVAMAGQNIPSEVTREQLVDGIDFVVQLRHMVDGSRKVTQITEVTRSNEKGEIELRDVFQYVIGDRVEDALVGRHQATGHIPAAQRAFELAGLGISPEIYKAD